MLPPVRRASARFLSTLALLLSALCGGAGCSHPPLLAAPPRYVRVDSLLPLHPSWVQIQTLDRELARISTAPAQSGPLRYEPHAALPVFAPEMTTPANIAAERAAQLDADATRYVESLQKSLEDANRSVINIEQRRELKRVNAAVAARLADAKRLIEAENAVRRFAISQRLRALKLRDIVVNSVIQDLSQAHTRDRRPLREAQTEHENIAVEIKQLNEQDDALLHQDLVKEAARKRDAFYREETAKSKDRLNRRSDELKMDRRDKLAAAKQRLSKTPIPDPAAPNLPPVDPHATPLPLPREPGMAARPVPARVQQKLDQQRVLWTAQRASLVGEIRADTLKAVQQIALRRGWKLVAGPGRGAIDSTGEAAEDFRQEWLVGKTP